ncbi:MAG: DASS family sodium-coupled anion symporter [Desulfobacterales bacterium]|jgi:sodium-dependent dicarboxylate transporter 2/3/5|nr:DASS family sodium-coupled anion symporter [Desulfobacterales bacterium]
MFYKSKFFQLGIALLGAAVILMLPRPEGTTFKISGDASRSLFNAVKGQFDPVGKAHRSSAPYIIRAKHSAGAEASLTLLREKASVLDLPNIHISTVDGISPTLQKFFAVLAILIFLFIFEPIPLEITAICIGVLLAGMGIMDIKSAWAPYMHPVVVFIMSYLIFAISADKSGLTRRLGFFIIRLAGTSMIRFTFVLAIGLGIASSFIHDAAACAIGIVTMQPLMRAAGIAPHSRAAKFMMLSIPFATSCGGMGSLIGGGRCLVAAAFLKEFTGVEITFFDWIKFAGPAALITVPFAVLIVYLFFRPEKGIRLPQFDESAGPWSRLEKKTLVITLLTLGLWLTKGLHGMDYSVTGLLGVSALILFGALTWEDIHTNLEWGTALFIFGGGISLGLAMGATGAADYFANLFFPIVQGGGWLLLFIGVGVIGALATNIMANVAAAALILPVAIGIAQMEGIDPRVVALCFGTTTSFAMLLVIGCPPNAIAFSYKYFKASDLTKVGLMATPILLGVLVLVAQVWWKFLGIF